MPATNQERLDHGAASAANGEQSSGRVETAGASIRIAIVETHPIQYFTPYYRALAAVPDIVLKVFFCSRKGAETYYDPDFRTHVKWDIPLLDGYDFEFLESRSRGDSKSARLLTYPLLQKAPFRFWTDDNPKIGESLTAFAPNVVEIGGYAHRTMWRTLRWCNRSGVRVILYSDSNAKAKKSWWKAAAKELVVKRVYRHLDGALASGDNNRAYHLRYGLAPERIFSRPMPVDCRQIRSLAGDLKTSRTEVRTQHGIPDDAFVVTFAGKLSFKKCPTHMLAAILRCSQQGLNVWGLLVGAGELKAELEAFIARYQMKNVVLAGFVNQREIPRYYAASDIVTLMSSYEPKGQTVPEAGSVGCPAILSDRIGCIGPNDCARPGENAMVYPWGDINAFADCITRLCRDQQLYHSMSEAAVRIANLQDATVAALQMKAVATQLIQMSRR